MAECIKWKQNVAECIKIAEGSFRDAKLATASRKRLVNLGMIGTLKIPSTGQTFGRNLTPAQAFDPLMEWHAQQPKPKGYPKC
jgi:hypothetical protein